MRHHGIRLVAAAAFAFVTFGAAVSSAPRLALAQEGYPACKARGEVFQPKVGKCGPVTSMTRILLGMDCRVCSNVDGKEYCVVLPGCTCRGDCTR
jgi:hypothetical protein